MYMLFPKLYKYSDSAGLILLKFIFQAVARLLSAYFCNAAEAAEIPAETATAEMIPEAAALTAEATVPETPVEICNRTKNKGAACYEYKNQRDFTGDRVRHRRQE